MVSSNPVYGLNALGGAAVDHDEERLHLSRLRGRTRRRLVRPAQRRVPIRQAGRQFRRPISPAAGSTRMAGGSFRPTICGRSMPISARAATRPRSISAFSGADNRCSARARRRSRSSRSTGRSIFTTPQDNGNQLAFVTLNGAYQATEALSFQANAYLREFHQTVVNGNTTDYTACTAGCGLLCQSDGVTPLVDSERRVHPRSVERRHGPDRRERSRGRSTRSRSAARCRRPTPAMLFGHENHFVARRQRRPLHGRLRLRGGDRHHQPVAAGAVVRVFCRHAGEQRLQRDAGQPQRDQQLLRRLSSPTLST